MAPMRLPLVLALFALAGFGQPKEDLQFKEAGVCARCHVISVVEWGMSAHRRAGTGCETCHGASRDHVIDERNNVKPERLPRGSDIAPLCLGCHPKAKPPKDCQKCHHVHALVDPRKPALAQVESAGPKPGARIPPPKKFLDPLLPGFELSGESIEPTTGLARSVRVGGLGIEMLLAPGGETDIGSERFPRARPVHTVRVEAFYLGKYEITRAEWKSLMGAESPGADRMPADRVSWEDAQALIRKLYQRVPGGGFRLPTEAEWEYAARTASRLGLVNMLGGVWEWCSSLDRPYPYNAADGREDPGAAGLRILRGGGDEDSPLWAGVSARHAERPARRLRWNGVRIAWDVR